MNGGPGHGPPLWGEVEPGDRLLRAVLRHVLGLGDG